MSDFRSRRRMELYIAASKAWQAFKMTPADFCEWTLSHSMLWEDFRNSVKYELFRAPGKFDDRLSDLSENDLSMSQLKRLEDIKRLFESGHYLKACKRLKVI